MNYKDALKKIDEWIDKLEIRDFCEKICKGNCCRQRNKNQEISYKCLEKCERKPLSCSIYFCDYIISKFSIWNKHISIQSYNDNRDMILICLSKTNPYRYHPKELTIDADIPDKYISFITRIKFNLTCLPKNQFS